MPAGSTTRSDPFRDPPTFLKKNQNLHAEDLLINDSSDRQAVKAISKGLPELDVIPSFACKEKKAS